MKRKIAIIGAGVSGLTAAYELGKKGYEVTVFEKDELIGGLAGSFRMEGEYLEKFYHHLFPSDNYMIGLVKELGLENRLRWLSSRVGMYYANSIHQFTSAKDLLTFSALPFWDRIRVGLGTLYARRIKNWQTLDEISVKEFVVKTMGQAAYNVIWEPLFRGKFGAVADDISAAWLWKKLQLRGGRDRKKQEVLVYLDGGFGLALDALEERIAKMGGKILKNTAVEQILIENQVCKGIRANQQDHVFDAVISTIPIPVFLQCAPHLPMNFSQQLGGIKYLGSVCLILKLKHPLSQTYWLNINDLSIPFVGVIEHTNFHKDGAYGDSHIAYISKYLDPKDRLYALSAEELIQEYAPHLKKIFPQFSTDWILQSYLWKEKYTQPIATIGYSKKIPPCRTQVQNLYLLTMAQIYPEDRGMNYAVKMAQETVAQYFPEQPQPC